MGFFKVTQDVRGVFAFAFLDNKKMKLIAVEVCMNHKLKVITEVALIHFPTLSRIEVVRQSDIFLSGLMLLMLTTQNM